jgi:hypothetical protein
LDIAGPALTNLLIANSALAAKKLVSGVLEAIGYSKSFSASVPVG